MANQMMMIATQVRQEKKLNTDFDHEIKSLQNISNYNENPPHKK